MPPRYVTTNKLLYFDYLLYYVTEINSQQKFIDLNNYFHTGNSVVVKYAPAVETVELFYC